jgi:hypothetical protein
MFLETEIPKDKMFISGRDTEVQTRDGELSILTQSRESKPRDLTLDTDSTSEEYSTSDQDSQ